MSVHDPIHWSVHLTSYSRDENLGRIHWLSLRSHVVFLHSRLTGCIPAAATTTKKKPRRAFIGIQSPVKRVCSMYKFRNKEHKKKT